LLCAFAVGLPSTFWNIRVAVGDETLAMRTAVLKDAEALGK
jgi:hypothetical protein